MASSDSCWTCCKAKKEQKKQQQTFVNFPKSLALKTHVWSVSLTLTLQNAPFDTFAHRLTNGLLYSVLSFKWPRIPIILSGSLSLAPRIFSGELRRFVVCREPFQGRSFPTAHTARESLLRIITLNIALRRSISLRLGPNADVKQTSNESEALVMCVDERQAGTYGDFKMMTREGVGGWEH